MEQEEEDQRRQAQSSSNQPSEVVANVWRSRLVDGLVSTPERQLHLCVSQKKDTRGCDIHMPLSALKMKLLRSDLQEGPQNLTQKTLAGYLEGILSWGFLLIEEGTLRHVAIYKAELKQFFGFPPLYPIQNEHSFTLDLIY